MRALPDIAASLFTNDYRDVKLKGKKPREKDPGTGSCFDATNFDEVRERFAKTHPPAVPDKFSVPFWDRASCSYRQMSPTKGPKEYMRAGSAASAGLKKIVKPLNRASPPIAGAYGARANLPNTQFRQAYERGDLPISVEHRGFKNVIRWKAEVAKLDYMRFLPLFLDGIRETQDPYRFLAIKGCEDLLQVGGDQILLTIPLCVQPLKRALNTRDKQVMIIALRILQKLVVSAELVGQALVPYYRQLLPICNLYFLHDRNLGDQIDYAQREGNCLGEVVAETLQLLELHGGPDAFINIKYLVPIYESALAY